MTQTDFNTFAAQAKNARKGGCRELPHTVTHSTPPSGGAFSIACSSLERAISVDTYIMAVLKECQPEDYP